MNDILLISTNALINAYEVESLKELEIGKEEILDTHYISNLHKLEMLGLGLQTGNGLKIIETTRQVFDSNQEEVEIEKATSYSDCNLDLVKQNDELRSSEYTRNIETLDPVEKKINDGFKVVNNKTNEFLNDLVKDYKEIDDYLRDCLNCKPNFDPKYEEVNFEFAFNFADFLNQWKGLLNEIKASLDPTKAFVDLCDLFDIISKRVICVSSWPLILMSVPIVIGDIRAKMLEIRLSIWSGLGFLINPLMSIATNIVEYLKNLILPVLDCLDRGFVIIKNVISGVDKLTTDILRQSFSVIDTFERLSTIDVRLPTNKAPNQEKLTLDFFKNRPAAEFSLPKVGKIPYVLDPGLSINSAESRREIQRNKTLEALYKMTHVIHDQLVIRPKMIVEETFNNILYTFKALSEYLSQPLKANFQLLGELKVMFNLFSLIQLIIALVNNGMASCEDIKQNKSKFSSLLPDYFKDIQVFAESPTDEELVVMDSFNGENKRSVKINSCGDIFATVNPNEKILDTMYDIISANNR